MIMVFKIQSDTKRISNILNCLKYTNLTRLMDVNCVLIPWIFIQTRHTNISLLLMNNIM